METGRHIKRSTYDRIVSSLLAEAGLSRDGAQSIEMYPGEVVINYFQREADGRHVIRGDSVCTYEVRLPILSDCP